MKAFIEVDVQECLRRVMEENTLYYKSDFEYDIRNLKNAAFRPYNNTFLWMSRESGTYIFEEKQVYIKPSYANHTWRYYQYKSDEIKAFWVHVDAIKDGKPVGTLIALDYEEHCRQVEKYAQQAQTVKITFNDGYQRSFNRIEYNENKGAIITKYGNYCQVDYDNSDIDTILCNIHSRYNHELEEYHFEQYIKDIRMERFARCGYYKDDFVWLSSFDAHKCFDAGLSVYLFEQDAPFRQITDRDHIKSLHSNNEHLLAIRRQDKPVWDYINPANSHVTPLFDYQELFQLQSCVAYAGKNIEWTRDENRDFQALLGKIHGLTEAIERRDFVFVREPETVVEQEPTQ